LIRFFGDGKRERLWIEKVVVGSSLGTERERKQYMEVNGKVREKYGINLFLSERI
jgi:hypothetical protein